MAVDINQVRDRIIKGWNSLPPWGKQFLYALDRRLNEKLGGNPEETVSERLAKARNEGKWEGKVGCALLDRYDPGHCDRAIHQK